MTSARKKNAPTTPDDLTEEEVISERRAYFAKVDAQLAEASAVFEDLREYVWQRELHLDRVLRKYGIDESALAGRLAILEVSTTASSVGCHAGGGKDTACAG